MACSTGAGATGVVCALQRNVIAVVCAWELLDERQSVLRKVAVLKCNMVVDTLLEPQQAYQQLCRNLQNLFSGITDVRYVSGSGFDKGLQTSRTLP